MLIYIDLSVLSATRNYDLEGKDCHCVQFCTHPVLKGLKGEEEVYYYGRQRNFWVTVLKKSTKSYHNLTTVTYSHPQS